MTVLYTPSALEKGIRGLFVGALTGMQRSSYVPMIATVVDSNAADEKYAWLGESPQMVDLTKKEIEFSALSDTNYTITNNVFAAGLAVKRTDLDDDQIGALRNRVSRLAEVAVAHKNKLLMTLLTAGDSNLGYDGNAFFSSTHPARGSSGTGDNTIAGTGTTTAQVATDLNTAIAQMMNFLAENGEPFHEDVSQLVVVAPPALRKPVMEAISASVISQTSNVQFNGLNITPLFAPRLTADDANNWYLLNVGRSLRPLLIQDRDPLEFSALETGSETAFVREQYLYKVRWRGNSGYGFWQDAVEVTNT